MSIPFSNICTFRFWASGTHTFQFTFEWSTLVEHLHFSCRRQANLSKSYRRGASHTPVLRPRANQIPASEQSPARLHRIGWIIKVCFVNRLPGRKFIWLEINLDCVFPRQEKMWFWRPGGKHYVILPSDLKLRCTIWPLSSRAPPSTN